MQFESLLYKDLIAVQQLNISNLPENYTMGYYIYHVTKFHGLNFVCRERGQIIGYILGKFDGDDVGHIASICVDPKHRRRGIASALLGKVMEVFSGVSRVTLKVRVSNVIAIDFYRRRGFIAGEKIDEYYGDGEDAYTMYLNIK